MHRHTLTTWTDLQSSRQPSCGRNSRLLRSKLFGCTTLYAADHVYRANRGDQWPLRGTALGFRNLTNYVAYADFRISDGMSTSWLC